jgi:signal transduction histidine kinase
VANDGPGTAPEPDSGASPPARRVIVIDDDAVILKASRRILERAGYAVETFDRGAVGIARIAEWRPQVLLVDLKMPELDGFQVIQRVRELAPEVVIVVITGYATVETAVEAMKAGAYDFLPKPFTPDELTLIMERSAERWRLAHETAELRREKEEAERQFVTFVSHQLRTPLTAVKQYLDVLTHTAGSDLPETARSWIARSQARLGEMLTLIQDWLTLSRVERGALCQLGATADLAAVVGQVLAALRPLADQAGVTVNAAVVGGPCRVGGDEVALSTLASNLVTNAIKYNRAGGTVMVALRTEGTTAVLTVADTGLGIPAESVPFLFTEFFRVSAPDRRDIPGTGLGLAICRRILDELKGQVAVTSTPGGGSSFEVRLPLAAGAGDGPR